MKDKVSKSRASQICIALLAIVLGVLCVAFPNSVSDIIVKIIGIVILIVGIVMIISRITDVSMRIPAIILGALIAVIGIFIFTHPGQTKSLIFIVFGVLLIADSVQGITASMAIRAAGGQRWTVSLIMALISLIFGVICILCATSLINLGFIVIGIMLIYDGVTSIYSAARAGKAEKDIIDSHIVGE